MIWTIAQKEFLEKILDFRVILSFAIAIALTIVSTFVIGADYQAKKAAYDQLVVRAQSELGPVRVFSQYHPKVFYAPSPLSVFSKGIDIPAPIAEDIRIDWLPYYFPVVVEANPLMQIFGTLDLVTVIRLLFSLLIVLLTFDSFSGERESGTLKQTLSNPVGRMNLLFGKFLGTLVIVGVVVILTFVVALLLLGLISDITLAAGDYLRVLMMAVSTFIYLSIFAALGMLGSMRLRHSATSLTVMTVVWFFVCILQPNLNTYTANKINQLTAGKPVPAQAPNADMDFLKRLEGLAARYHAVLSDSTKKRYAEGSIDFGSAQIYTPLADADYDILEYTMQAVPIYRQSAEDAEKMYEFNTGSRERERARLLSWKQMLELISPAAFFTHSIAVLSRTDYDNVQDFYKHVHQYRLQYLTYLDEKGVFSVNAQLFFTRLRKDQIDRASTMRRLAQYEKDSASIPWPRLQPPLDVSDAPIFGGEESSVLTDAGKSAEKLASVPFFLIILFLWAGRTLRRYDPR